MSTTDATGAVVLTATQLATLRASQLKEASETLERVSYELSMLGKSDDVSDPLGDVAASIRVARQDLEALEALGYSDDGGEV